MWKKIPGLLNEMPFVHFEHRTGWMNRGYARIRGCWKYFHQSFLHQVTCCALPDDTLTSPRKHKQIKPAVSNTYQTARGIIWGLDRLVLAPHRTPVDQWEIDSFRALAGASLQALPILPGDPPTERGSTTRDGVGGCSERARLQAKVAGPSCSGSLDFDIP